MNRAPLAGVVGCPLHHLLHVKLYHHWLNELGCSGHFIPMEIAAEKFQSCMRSLPDLGFLGVNIANPFQEIVIETADLVSDRATLIGAANVLIFREDDRLHADNTQGYGFIQNLRKASPEWTAEAGPAVVFGAGVAARAVIASLLDVGVPEIRLTNRSRLRADALQETFGKRIQVSDWVKAGSLIEDCSLVINATALGMPGKPPFRVPLDAIRPGMIVCDLVPIPKKTRLIEEAEKKGAISLGGLGMLMHQVVPTFERWFGERPDVDLTVFEASLS